MMSFLFSRLSAASCAFLLLAFFPIPSIDNFTQSAKAQFCEDEHPSCQRRYSFPTCAIYVDAASGASQLGQRTILELRNFHYRTYPQRCYRPGDVYALQGFRFNTRGGRKIKDISIWHSQRAGSLTFMFRDKNGGEFADGFVWLKAMPRESQLHEVQKLDCRGECYINIGPISGGQQVALSSFGFLRNGSEGHVRRVAVLPQQNAGTTNVGYKVAFQDDDFEYSVYLQYLVLPPGTLGPQRRVTKSYDPDRSDTVVLDAASRIDDLLVVPSGLVADTTTRRQTALLGFDLRFKNGGHFLEDIGIEPHNTAYQAWFQDHQSLENRRKPDDPFEWTVVFASID